MSTTKIQAPKGFEDVLPDQSWKWQAVERIAREVAELYHYGEMRTPTVEYTTLFHRGVGETTDIVRKETFTFESRGEKSLTLRPEGTAGIVRAMIEHNVLAQEGSRSKVYYILPNFRYEQPQEGRLRQHHQFGVEAFGVAEPEQDVECIALQMDFYYRCGLNDLELRINSLGDAESKSRYREALVEFFTPRIADLSEDSQRRLQSNPMRILDSKDPRDQEVSQGAPPAIDCLSGRSRTHFDRVQQILGRTRTSQGKPLPFRVDPRLVRGLDYYTETLWEVTAGGLGAQNAIGGGGRYDNLVELLGGRPTPGVGFGSGLERLLLALNRQAAALPRPSRPLVWLISHGEAARDANWKLLQELRGAGVMADMDLSGRSVKAQFKIADREQSRYSVVIGETELKARNVVIKNLSTGEQISLPRDQVVDHLRRDSM